MWTKIVHHSCHVNKKDPSFMSYEGTNRYWCHVNKYNLSFVSSEQIQSVSRIKWTKPVPHWCHMNKTQFMFGVIWTNTIHVWCHVYKTDSSLSREQKTVSDLRDVNKSTSSLVSCEQKDSLSVSSEQTQLMVWCHMPVMNDLLWVIERKREKGRKNEGERGREINEGRGGTKRNIRKYCC